MLYQTQSIESNPSVIHILMRNSFTQSLKESLKTNVCDGQACGKETNDNLLIPIPNSIRCISECEQYGFNGHANKALGQLRPLCDSSRFQNVRLPVEPCSSILSRGNSVWEWNGDQRGTDSLAPQTHSLRILLFKARRTSRDSTAIRYDATTLSLSLMCSVPIDPIWISRLQIGMESQQIRHVDFNMQMSYAIQLRLDEIQPVRSPIISHCDGIALVNVGLNMSSLHTF